MARDQGGDWLRYENPDDKLPWLEPADDYQRQGTGLRGKLIGGLAAVVVVIVLLVGGMSWYMNRDTMPGTAEAGLIKAPATPYKVHPSDPGGMVVEGQGDTVYAAGEGADPGGTIDLSAIPEEPVSRAGPAIETGDVAAAALPPSTAAKSAAPATTTTAIKPAPATAPLPAAKPAIPTQIARAAPQKPSVSAAAPAAKPASIAKPAMAAPSRTGNGTFGLQLGAFSNKAKADGAWKVLSGRFAFIAALQKSIEPVAKGDATLYRLRAVGVANRDSANNLCGRLKVTGDSCTVVAP